MRSLLFVPAHKDHLIEKALKSQADAIIFDLEDSCPKGNRVVGIKNINSVETNKIKIVRISKDEQAYLVDTDFILYPKAEEVLIGQFKFILLTETALGVVNLGNIITDERVFGVAFGNEDYRADTGCSNYDFARQMILNYSKAYKKFTVDTVYIDIKDEYGFIDNCINSYNFGFDGRLCLTLQQAEIVNLYYTPKKEEYEKSKTIVRLYDQAVSEGSGVAIIENTYIAPPMVKRAKKIIKKYEYYS